MHQCIKCSKEYKNLNGLKKHQLVCDPERNKLNKINELNELKKDYEHKLEIERLKTQLELKTMECQNLEKIIAQKNNQIHNLQNNAKNNAKNNDKNNDKNNTNNNVITNEITNNINIVILKIKEPMDAILLVDNIIKNHSDKRNNKLIMSALLNHLKP